MEPTPTCRLPMLRIARAGKLTSPREQWDMDPRFCLAWLLQPDGTQTGETPNGLYHCEEHYYLGFCYADNMTAGPEPTYGYYEDSERRVVFQYLRLEDMRCIIGRSDLGIQDIHGFGYSRDHAHRTTEKSSRTIDLQEYHIIRDRIFLAMTLIHWNIRSRPAVVTDDLDGEIDQTHDRKLKGILGLPVRESAVAASSPRSMLTDLWNAFGKGRPD